MDKHTKRYFSEFFHHYHEGFNVGEAIDYIKQGADPGYLSSAINDHFEGVQRDFLQFKLLEEIYKRRVYHE